MVRKLVRTVGLEVDVRVTCMHAAVIIVVVVAVVVAGSGGGGVGVAVVCISSNTVSIWHDENPKSEWKWKILLIE